MTVQASEANRLAAERLRRESIKDVLDPWYLRRFTEYKHTDFAIDLAMRYRWRVKQVYEIDDMKAFYTERLIHSVPIKSDRALAVFAHEGGHLEDPIDNRGGITVDRGTY